MASLFREKTLAAFHSLVAQYQHHSRTTIIFTTFCLVSIGLAPAAYRDYKTFMSYGPGGVPYNLFGWLIAKVVLGPLGSEMLSTGLYERDEDQETYLPAEGITTREGPRPSVGPHVVPQRQLSQIPDKKIQEVGTPLSRVPWNITLTYLYKQRLVDAFDQLYLQNEDLLKVEPSRLERHTDALFLADVVRSSPISEELKREVSHIHGTSDHSVHVTLSPADCKCPS
jgi:hypothetical protein